MVLKFPLFRGPTVFLVHFQGEDGAVVLEAPGGYAFHVYNKDSGREGIYGCIAPDHVTCM